MKKVIFHCSTCVVVAASQAMCPRQHHFAWLQGFAEDTDSSRINEAVCTAPENNSSQPSGWQPSSNLSLPEAPGAQDVTACLYEVQALLSMDVMCCLFPTWPSYLQVGRLMLRKRKPCGHQPWMERSSSHQAVHIKSKLKVAFSQKHGCQGSLEAVFLYLSPLTWHRQSLTQTKAKLTARPCMFQRQKGFNMYRYSCLLSVLMCFRPLDKVPSQLASHTGSNSQLGRLSSRFFPVDVLGPSIGQKHQTIKHPCTAEFTYS